MNMAGRYRRDPRQLPKRIDLDLNPRLLSSFRKKPNYDHTGFQTAGKPFNLSSSVDASKIGTQSVERLKSAFIVKTELPTDIYQPIKADVCRVSLHKVP